ncbi:riboflavin synthase [Prauserella sp. PE36]|uniref:Riboflavin synthase n=1 Tax=Prauserella endophytica TaxID=1592324 RepID=A0ABY2S5T3_9PSEU|nr:MULTISPECIES: riboflavin synthase [Prauserella]PXY23622.1 riboflavin synthase subunit alpha [Prauserella coralliicola]RBM18213.1 riboflavin synthase [Prauserella sp. PE36]TKG70392.1 riboflavin synthase [Prauserella endophytica]
MFTGIVEELGEIARVEPLSDAARLTVRGPLVTSDARHGDSIAVNGVCLTVVEVSGDEFTVDVVHETLKRSSLGRAEAGRQVNLERAMPANGRFGGHVMQGHVDGTATFLSRDPDGLTHFAFPAPLGRYIVEKGSIAVDGISLTVAAVSREEFSIALIPTTLELTTLGRTEPGDVVNIEVDVLAKYVEKLTAVHLPGAGVDNGKGKEDA